jgi:hypothetical protein
MELKNIEAILIAIPGAIAIIALLKLYYTTRRYRIR